MRTSTKVPGLDHAMHAAHTWVNAVAAEFDTEDREFAYGVLRGWLHTLRDRLTVEAAAHFAAQLPDLVRGVFYGGWDPAAVPVKLDAKAYTARFAHEANIAVQDVPKAAAAVTAALMRLLPPAQVTKAINQLPDDIKTLLRP
ncbi:hypothetical protein CRI77_08505 [Mycolicibacterium duvalii]|uniref:Uncharacterized protein n=1 Tax=Mycolicibacterium duvalii TaxID=39688 RepID=A0A7I7K2T8_9MYCO|nr:DUF2267 domain-containing protein [Mycolicibacterium duvalii]MCV7367929.1 DUF2267 domain-containing protein [Mycolicibacterium duvalii]PEG42607.1 hypothetical protein CRI77_08505 [Mycolicibacterium duvalii]BBX18480.1 hypothetical protein MDUV_33400 [Mycolicibacterium duvalii]